jgi:lipopolysaccharide/colanic/teichoic acid biosynthesis glycosyltransferase
MPEATFPAGLTQVDSLLKRGFDIVFSILGLFITGWLIIIAYLLATLDTGESGFFKQERVGKHGNLFEVIKIRTMRSDPAMNTTVTSSKDPRITRLGAFWRKSKIDELPQLLNILPGQMSFVGPRPDVPGFADRLQGDDRTILSVRPGITGPATLRFRDEEALLASQPDPERYNREVIFPEKVKLNRAYVKNYSFWRDLVYIWQTLFGQSKQITLSSKAHSER